MIQIALNKRHLKEIIYRIGAIYEKPLMTREVAGMIADYLYDNDIIKDWDELLDYVMNKCTICQTIDDAIKVLHMKPGSTWDDILDRDDVEYVDYESSPTRKLIIAET